MWISRLKWMIPIIVLLAASGCSTLSQDQSKSPPPEEDRNTRPQSESKADTITSEQTSKQDETNVQENTNTQNKNNGGNKKESDKGKDNEEKTNQKPPGMNKG